MSTSHRLLAQNSSDIHPQSSAYENCIYPSVVDPNNNYQPLLTAKSCTPSVIIADLSSSCIKPSTGSTTAKYKSNIMEKYLRDLRPSTDEQLEFATTTASDAVPVVGEGRQLSKWLESAANFTPDKKNYIEWEGGVR